ncbi:hypothetical protein QBC39DRAFT_274801 [Podospora conica]|nr:hypothetical protein QBC39DRAFT_274801 [Schizothecium conicum]
MASPTTTTISRSSLTTTSPEPPKITNLKHIASYTWHTSPAPTISVPGLPPRWSPPPSPAAPLSPDSGTVFIDQNAALSPSSPLEPLFRAALAQDPAFSLAGVDLVTDRGNIRKLLRFVQGSSAQDFRILVEVVGDGGGGCTALLTRVEEKNTDVIQGFKGFGRSFEKAWTAQRAGAAGYHRVVGYRFGGLGVVVRFETDGYVAGDDDVAALVEGMGGVAISSDGEKMASGLTVVHSKGRGDVPWESTLEIKTRAASKVLDMGDVMPQLWVSQTPRLAVGYYTKGGVFGNVKVKDMTDEIVFWEAASQGDLGKLADLLGRIISAVRTSEAGRGVVEYSGGSNLRVVVGDGKPALPDDLYRKWNLKVGGVVEGKVEDTRKEKDKERKVPSIIPVGTPFASDMDYAILKGPRQFFVRLPGNLSAYRSLCQQLKMLSPEAVSKVLGRISFTFKDMMADFRLGKGGYDDEGCDTDGRKTAARDAAFRLVYKLLSGGAELQEKNAAFNAAFFVVSHPSIFRPRTRRVVREAFEDRFGLTYKQKVQMDEYRNTRDVEDFDKGEDETTEEEPVFYNSDYYSDGSWSS